MADCFMAYCGIVCSECDAYKATQSGDQADLERVAAAWRDRLDPDLTVSEIICEGCLTTAGPQCSYCSECPVRACAIDRGLQSCAHCPDYDCGRIEQFLSHAPRRRKILDKMRGTFLRTSGGQGHRRTQSKPPAMSGAAAFVVGPRISCHPE